MKIKLSGFEVEEAIIDWLINKGTRIPRKYNNRNYALIQSLGLDLTGSGHLFGYSSLRLDPAQFFYWVGPRKR